ncbi:MAG: hypothetical protein GAK29_01072 [Acinetobacter bereziniae]|uniref:Cation transporter n=1 Tax=Acinetobacter bereziniae TaxID=106648 RepID=A0A833USS8_ACIBZ|nr:MAG: hypothetical protein GAK29_01072 [Acinetobacter bereziniae]
MFQSLWNVAAAFCDHEKTTTVSQKLASQHFGHHNAPDCDQDQQQHPTLKDAIGGADHSVKNDAQAQQQSMHQHAVDAKEFLSHLNDDHRDHLPSLFHFIVVGDQQQAERPKFIAYLETAFLGWNNLYQSPYLYFPNPPPLFSPL